MLYRVAIYSRHNNLAACFRVNDRLFTISTFVSVQVRSIEIMFIRSILRIAQIKFETSEQTAMPALLFFFHSQCLFFTALPFWVHF